MSKIILDTEDFFQNDGYDDLMHIDHESYCCGEMFEKYETKIADLEAKLAECEEKKESYRLQNEQHHLQLLQFYSRLGVEAFGADIHEKALETLMIMKEELAEKEKEMSIKSIIRTLVKYNNLNCTFRDKTNSQIQQCGDVYNSNYGYFNFEDDYDECLNNRNDSRFDIISIDLDNQDKISFALEQLEKVKEFVSRQLFITTKDCSDLDEAEAKGCNELREETIKEIDNQIKQLKEMK